MGLALFEELNQSIKELDNSLRQLKQSGSNLADKEYLYKIALSKKLYELKIEGYNSTNINLMIYGVEPVATLRKERDLAKVIYDANIEAINVNKLKIKIIQAQIDKEYAN